MHEELLCQFIASYSTAQKTLILDFDATDDPIHDRNKGRFFHGYYRHYCFLLLYVFYESLELGLRLIQFRGRNFSIQLIDAILTLQLEYFSTVF